MTKRLEQLRDMAAKKFFGADRYNYSGELTGYKEHFNAGFDAAAKQLEADIEYLQRELADSTSGFCDSPMFKLMAKKQQELMKVIEIQHEAIISSIARSDDYGDSWCSKPIRDSIKKTDTILNGSEK